MKKRLFAIAIAVMILVVPFASSIPAFAQVNIAKADSTYDPLLRMWYEQPVSNIDSNGPNSNNSRNQWVSESLPIGNGHMGNLLFGGITRDRIHINEKTIWAGGPKENNNYTYGARSEENAVTAEFLEDFRRKLDDKSQNVFGLKTSGSGSDQEGDLYYLNKMFNDLTGFEYYQDFGDLFLNFARSGLTHEEEVNVTNYIRDLDMNTAVATVEYDYGGVRYHREYFSSYPDNVTVTRLTASEAGKITFDASLATSGSGHNTSKRQITAQGDTITLTGELSSNALQYEIQLKVVPEGGALEANADGSISVTGANSVMLVLASGSDYKNEMPAFRGEHPHEEVTARIVSAAELGYEELKERHLEDYQELFYRVSFDLGADVPNMPTDKLVEMYREKNRADAGFVADEDYDNRALEVMVYQFGRYLTIAGSREGALPTNLQGVWGIGTFAWYGDYHFNINLQMNYWPTLSANLAECLIPLVEYVDSIREPGRLVATRNFGVVSGPGEENGWVVNCFSNPFAYCAGNTGNQAAGMNPGGAAWIMQNIYDYYRYTGDEEYLRDVIYPMMREVAMFYTNYLWWSENQQRMAVAPSVSAENGPTVVGSTYDQSLAWQAFEETIQAAEILGVDEEQREVWRTLQDQLNPILIGDEGQIKEWYEETTFGKAQDGDLPEISIPKWRDSLGAGDIPHRHTSHLIGLFPGTLISKDNDEYLEAAMVSLHERGFEGTGWARANKLNTWARTLHAEESYQLVKSQLKGGNAGILTNLLSSHGGGANYEDYPIFQIEANYGTTAGITEMLMQSHLGYVQFLPALPAAWDTGHLEGIVARGNFELTMDWENGAANYFRVTSRNGGGFTGEYMGIANAKITDSSGEVVEGAADGRDRISFETVPGETYTVTLNEAGNFRLSTDAHHVKADEYANITTGFVEPVSSNTAILNYTFDTEHFEYADFHPAGDVQVVSKEATAEGAKVVVMISDYNTRDYGQLAIHAKTNAALTNGWAVVMADVEYVVKDEEGNKEIQAAVASAAFTTRGNGPDPFVDGDTNGDGVVDLIDLSNMIDWFGIGNNHPQWNDFYVFFDDNNNGEIDIYDIVYVARLIQ